MNHHQRQLLLYPCLLIILMNTSLIYQLTLKKSSKTCQEKICNSTSLLIFFTDGVNNCIPGHRLSLFYPLLPTAELDRVEESLDYSPVFL